MALAPPVSTLTGRKNAVAMTKATAGPIPVKVEHRIGVQAPSEVIWELVYDIADWSRWNPLHRGAEGEIRIGARLLTTEALPGLPERPATLQVMEWVPHEQLHLRNSALRGWVKSIRYIEIEQLSEAACIVSTGEIFAAGMLTSLHLRKSRRPLRLAFTAHGEALKAEAEARWRARLGG
jgi:hypothetical protein